MTLIARQVFQRDAKPTFFQPIRCIKCHGRRFYFKKDEPVCRRCSPAFSTRADLL